MMDAEKFEIDPNVYASAYIQTFMSEDPEFEDLGQRENFFSDQYVKAFKSMVDFIDGKRCDQV
tara:strand:+ start:229 stop:417 length:189 start_codon:yes stop_codon:yes gene_type:complete